MAAILVLAGVLKLMAPMLAVFFCLFLLHKLHIARNKLVAVALFVVTLCLLTYTASYFIHATVVALPKIAESSIPTVISWAESHGVQLPFTDFSSLKSSAVELVKEQAHYVGNVATAARALTAQGVLLLLAIVVAVIHFLSPQLDLDKGAHAVPNNVYELCCASLAERFRRLYDSFVTVIGAQIIISSINTVLTSIFLFAIHLPHTPIVVGVTFLCGLLPVIGNLISNTVIVGIAFTISPNTALAALVFLVVIHKLEYFLNSKIIGSRIRTPVWLTLVGLVLGEKLVGIPGMILAPVILHYVKAEAAAIAVPSASDVSRRA